ncbi:hypothetical protein BLOT_006400 [Blomia tropicalis]|nr:hypothetical protein BLOT_006400 [Blomia tropicalis]
MFKRIIIVLCLFGGTFQDDFTLIKESYLLYGNVNMYSNGTNSHVGQCSDQKNVLFIDYSERFNSVVVVCNEENKAFVHTFSNGKLKCNGLHLRQLEAPHLSFYSLDWLNGLLYYTEEQSIYVVDLKPSHSESLLLYQSNQTGTRIMGLVVRPDNQSLYWLEHEKRTNLLQFVHSSQACKDVVRYVLKHLTPDALFYDYISDRFLIIKSRSDSSRTIVLFDGKHPQHNLFGEYHIDLNNRQVNNVILFNDTIVFNANFMNENVRNDLLSISRNETIYWTNINSNQNFGKIVQISNGNTLQQVPVYSIFALINPHLMQRTINSICDKHVCTKQSQDYCIPHTSTKYMCFSNPNRIYRMNETNETGKIFSVILLIIVGLVLLLAVLIGTLVFKKKVRFYQIRLKKINRVNSSRLEAKPDGTEEIAE